MSNENTYDQIIAKMSGLYQVPAALIKAVISVESSFRPSATRQEPRINDASYGLMQLLSKTAEWIMGRWIDAKELMDPEVNIEAGTKYLKYQLDRYDGDIPSAVAAYNAGTAYKSKKYPGTFTNQSYVNKVLAKFNLYKASPPSLDVTGSGLDGPSSSGGGSGTTTILILAAGIFVGVSLLRRLL